MVITLILALAVTSSSFADEISLQEKVDAIEAAHVAVNPIKQNLMKAIQAAMAKTGPEGAIGSCKTEAPQITHSTNSKIEVGRTSLKLRNPKNAARPWMQSVLKKYENWKPGEAIEPEILLKLGRNHYGYMEPIFIKETCLSCHGKSVSKPVKTELNQIYPKDSAIGFNLGELRGFFWAELKP